MNNPEAIFKIIKNSNCPLYELDDEFRLKGLALSVEENKPTCITLAADMKEVLALCKTIEASGINNNKDATFDCSGCTGRIRLLYEKLGDKVCFPKAAKKQHDDDIGATANLLSNFSMFQALDKSSIKDIVSSLKLKKFPPGHTIIKKGDPGINLFIIVSGKVEILGDDELTITFLEKGEVFGEMSLLSGEPVGATVKVVEITKVLFISGKDFRKILNRFPSLQMYFARLLARRLTQTNIVRSEEFASGMVGKLSEMPPTELFQTLHQNQKTGILSLVQLSKGSAELTFRDGELIRARYSENSGQQAFFELLKEKEGRFKFIPGLSAQQAEGSPIADFMWLLMEGLNKIDEDNGER